MTERALGLEFSEPAYLRVFLSPNSLGQGGPATLTNLINVAELERSTLNARADQAALVAALVTKALSEGDLEALDQLRSVLMSSNLLASDLLLAIKVQLERNGVERSLS